MAITSMAHKTFWNTIRVEKNIRIKELKELFPDIKSSGAIGAWFTGQNMPSDRHIMTLCDFFDVPFEEGKAAFVSMHDNWKSQYHKGCREVTGTAEYPSRVVSGTADAHINSRSVETIPEQKDETVSIFKIVYGILSYEQFMDFTQAVATKSEDPMKYIYGKVSYEQYKQIAEIIWG